MKQNVRLRYQRLPEDHHKYVHNRRIYAIFFHLPAKKLIMWRDIAEDYLESGLYYFKSSCIKAVPQSAASY